MTQKNLINNNLSVVFIPDYVVKTLKSKNMELIDLETSLITNGSNTNSWLNNNLSKMDIKDWISVNRMLVSKLLPRQKLFGLSEPMNYKNSRSFNSILETDIRNSVGLVEDVVNMNELLSLYSNEDIDINTIILSNNHNELPYKLVQGNDTVFVIISEGFMNFIVYDIKPFKETFVSSVVDYSFKSFGERRTVGSPMFMDYISLCS